MEDLRRELGALRSQLEQAIAALENYAYLLREMNRPTEAQRLEERAEAMRARLSSKKNV